MTFIFACVCLCVITIIDRLGLKVKIIGKGQRVKSPKKTKFCGVNELLQAKRSQKVKTSPLSKSVNRFQPNFAQQ